MRSRFGIISSVLTITLLLCWGCTEKLPLTADYTTDSNWTPNISLGAVGYQRVVIYVERPTQKELWRNISCLTVQARTNQDLTYADIDTAQGQSVAPTSAPALSSIPYGFQSKPRLNFDTDYSFRIAAHFGSGEVHFSNVVNARTPREVGKIMKRIGGLGGPEVNIFSSNLLLAFWRGSIIASPGPIIYRIDTSSGRATILKYDFYPPPDKDSDFRSFSVRGDSAFSCYVDSWSEGRSRLVSVNLITLKVDSSIAISTPGKTLSSLVSHKGELYGLFVWSDTSQFGIISSQTGEVKQWFVKQPYFYIEPYALASDGTNVFYCTQAELDNRIIARDPSTLTIVQQNHNPVFAGGGLTWDGAYFWVADWETHTLVKLKLEGM